MNEFNRLSGKYVDGDIDSFEFIMKTLELNPDEPELALTEQLYESLETMMESARQVREYSANMPQLNSR